MVTFMTCGWSVWPARFHSTEVYGLLDFTVLEIYSTMKVYDMSGYYFTTVYLCLLGSINYAIIDGVRSDRP